MKEWLGHANISQTSTYLGVTEQATYDAMRKFDAGRGEMTVEKDANEKPIASDCTSSAETRHNEGTNGAILEQEDTENTDVTRSGDDLLPPENRSVDGSIPPRHHFPQ